MSITVVSLYVCSFAFGYFLGELVMKRNNLSLRDYLPLILSGLSVVVLTHLYVFMQ